jgi:hypothetical protein
LRNRWKSATESASASAPVKTPIAQRAR